MTSPTAAGRLPEGISPVGGVVLDLVGRNGARVLSQAAPADLFFGNFQTGLPAAWRGNPGIIGEQGGFTPELLGLLGGGLAEAAVRLTVWDGDTGPGPDDFDRGDNWLRINGVDLGPFDAVATEETDAEGARTLSANPAGGFRNDRLDTGFFRLDDPEALDALFASLAEGGRAVFALLDADPYDNFFDFTQGLAGAIAGLAPTPANRAPALRSLGVEGPALEGSPARIVARADDPDGDALAYAFDLDGDGVFEAAAPDGAVAYAFPRAGDYRISVRVSDPSGAFAVGSTTVAVRNVAPAVSAPAGQRATEGRVQAFDLGQFDDPGAESSWSVTVDWGDGSAPTRRTVDRAGDLGRASHAYAQDGRYRIAVTVSDGLASGSAGFVVEVANAPPALSGLAVPGRVLEGEALRVGLDYDDPGRLDALTVEVDWGDGTVTSERLGPAPGAYRTARVVDRPGPRTVTIRLLDDAGGSDAMAFAVVVEAVEPPPAADPPAPAPPDPSPPPPADRPAGPAFGPPSDPGVAPADGAEPGPASPATPPAPGTPAAVAAAAPDPTPLPVVIGASAPGTGSAGGVAIAAGLPAVAGRAAAGPALATLVAPPATALPGPGVAGGPAAAVAFAAAAPAAGPGASGRAARALVDAATALAARLGAFAAGLAGRAPAPVDDPGEAAPPPDAEGPPRRPASGVLLMLVAILQYRRGRFRPARVLRR